jgi:hypothetical protein
MMTENLFYNKFNTTIYGHGGLKNNVDVNAVSKLVTLT